MEKIAENLKEDENESQEDNDYQPIECEYVEEFDEELMRDKSEVLFDNLLGFSTNDYTNNKES